MKLLNLIVAVLTLSCCSAAEWDGTLMGQRLGSEITVPSVVEKTDLGFPIVSFAPTKQFLTFTSYAVWASPISKQIAGIVSGAEFDGDDAEAKIFRTKIANLLKAKFPEAIAKPDDEGDWTLTMNNGDMIFIEKNDDCIAIRAVRNVLLQKAIAEAQQKAVRDAGVVKGTKWTGSLFGKKLGGDEVIPVGSGKCALGLTTVEFNIKEKIVGASVYCVWITPISKKIACIVAADDRFVDGIDAKRKRREIAWSMKAQFPEGVLKEDEAGDWNMIMSNGDMICAELQGESCLLIQAFRPQLLQQGKAEFDQLSVSESKSDLDAL